MHELGRLLDDLVEHRGRVELGGEQAAGPRELLRQRPRASLRLEQLASLEGSSRRACEVERQLEVVLAEDALLREEDDAEAGTLLPGRRDRHGEQGVVALAVGGSPPGLGEPLVAGELRRSKHAPLFRRTRQEAVALLDPVRQRRREPLRQPMRARERKGFRLRHQHRRAGAAERVGGGLRDGLEGRRARERLPEHRGDPIEAPLDTSLAGAAGERLGVPERERGEPCECLEHVGVALGELLAAPPSDPEHALHVVAPAHRGHDRLGETLVARVRHRIGQVAVPAADERPAFANREPRQPLRGTELEADEPGLEAVHGRATERPSLPVEEEAVRCVRLKQVGELVDEPLEHRVQIELAAQHLRGPQKRCLLGELLPILVEQAAEPDRQARFRGHGLEQHQVAAAPGTRRVTMDGEDAGRPVLDDHRRRGNRPGAERAQGPDVSD